MSPLLLLVRMQAYTELCKQPQLINVYLMFLIKSYIFKVIQGLYIVKLPLKIARKVKKMSGIVVKKCQENIELILSVHPANSTI